MPRAAVSHKHLSVINNWTYQEIGQNEQTRSIFLCPQSELARCLEDNELPEFLEVLGAAQEVGYNLDEHYGKEVVTCFTTVFLPPI